MKESPIRTAIRIYLQARENDGELVYIYNNTGAVNIGRRRISFGKTGSSDFIVIMPKGVTLFLEAKTDKTVQRPSQIEFEAKVKALGHIYEIVRSVEEVDAIINSYRA